MKKNLVLGAAAGYDWDTLEPFVSSWRKNCPSAELVLFVDDLSDFTREQLIRSGVSLKNFPAEMKKALPHNTRWKIFSDFLAARGDDYEQIFITDTRDVIFQSDLFENFKGFANYLVYATEADDVRGSKTGARINYGWLANFFGKEEADTFLNEKIICSGTVLGTSRHMQIFCRELWETLRHKTNFIADQAVMNYLVRRNLLPLENLIESDIDSGVIFTTALIKDFSIRGEKILRGDGGVPAVVHQYTQNEPLLRLVDEIYHDKNFSANEHFDDTRSTIEQTNSLLRADKIGEATRLFLKKFLSNVDFSKCGGSLMRLWELALKKPLSQPLELLELSVQGAATSCKNFSGYLNQHVPRIVKRAEEIGHPVDFNFKNHLANLLLEVVEYGLKTNQLAYCFEYMGGIDDLNMPPDKNYYLLAAKVNRLGGRKDKALAAYKKVLELS